jgi:hypothetical protein
MEGKAINVRCGKAKTRGGALAPLSNSGCRRSRSYQQTPYRQRSSLPRFGSENINGARLTGLKRSGDNGTILDGRGNT